MKRNRKKELIKLISTIIYVIIYALIIYACYFLSGLVGCTNDQVVKAHNTTDYEEDPKSNDYVKIPNVEIVYKTVEITLPNGEKDWVLRPFNAETYEKIIPKTKSKGQKI